MEILSHFQKLDDLIKCLDNNKALLKDMFAHRKSLSFRRDEAKELAYKHDEGVRYLLQFGVIRENGDFLELEDVYIKFFEEVLEVNEEINVASIKQSIDSLNHSIEFFRLENNPTKKQNYLNDIKRMLRTISLNILRNVIDLKRNIDNTYKNEPNYAVKKKKLEILEEKQRDIELFIKESESVIKEKHAPVFLETMDSRLSDIVTDVTYELNEASHSLIELRRQIIQYLNLIEYQNMLVKKIQKLKHLKDQLMLESSTDIKSKLSDIDPLWLEPRQKTSLKLSLNNMRESDDWLDFIRKVALGKSRNRFKKGNLADPLNQDELQQEVERQVVIDAGDVKNAFLASGDNLFHFIMNYSNYGVLMEEEQKLVLFCQIATQFLSELNVSDEYRRYKNYEYPMIYSKQN
ncbi:MAG: hypothetical protein MJZ41_09610 [Bacteroidaceae bacterium]|nr:hypothetical protein [Bacteroidaceae bacterium]